MELLSFNKTTSIRIAKVIFSWDPPWKGQPVPHLFRGAVASAFPQYDILHQHQGEKLIARYPLVQYRWEDGKAVIYAFNEAIEVVTQLPWEQTTFCLESNPVKIISVIYHFFEGSIGFVDRLYRYYFRSPWVALNQDHYQSYKNLSRYEREVKLDQILIGNILSACKGLSIHLGEHIYAAFFRKRVLKACYKDQIFVGFLGTFVTNLILPSGLGLGKAVSHGYGWIEPCSGGGECGE